MRELVAVCLLLCSTAATAFEAPPLTPGEAQAAAADYQRYCALCHGADRQGYANDEAPSLRSESLIRSGFPEVMLFTVAYGRRGTPMAGYFDEIGGPMNNPDIYRLIRWLKEQVGVTSIDLPQERIAGDAARGRTLFATHCAECHGDDAQGKVGPAVGNPGMLAYTPDAFLRYAIVHGRDGTQMKPWGELLPAADIDDLVAFLRSHESQWAEQSVALRPPPPVEQYVLNPDGLPPEFALEGGTYVRAADLDRALREKRRLVVLDTRVSSMWQVGHIEGAVPIPYYYDRFDELAGHLPRDGTWIVSYCECPRAAAESVNAKLRKTGFENTAVLWEGIQGWIALGYPVYAGDAGAQ